ncbi:hypothetical protein ABKV19_001786, partial [Rosa sericea]
RWGEKEKMRDPRLCLTSGGRIGDVGITHQGFEKRVVSQDLQLWLSNSPAINRKFTLLARAGRQVTLTLCSLGTLKKRTEF